ncbi:MAG: UvrD-helicase domain-containing protein [Erysipelotrichaceae bacterium]|nr:UvrD-helicase domain-containing protein [Erysipelotrichaceae bacterium]
MSFTPNPSQKKAIEARGTNVLVFASAGGGKTTVLIERLMKRILTDRIPLEEIAAMTFTEAAASNMARRLKKALQDAHAKDPQDEFLTKQLSAISSAQISTIHSFCLRLIKEYYYVLPLSRKRAETILDEARGSLYLKEAIEKAIASADCDTRELNLLFSENLFSKDSLADVIAKILNKAGSAADPFAKLDSWIDNDVSRLEDLDPEMTDYYALNKRLLLKDALQVIEEILLTGEHAEFYPSLKEGVEKLLDTEDLREFNDMLPHILHSLPSKRKSKNSEGDSEQYKALRDELAEYFTKIAKGYDATEDLLKYHRQSLPYEKALINICKEALANYNAIKAENECLDFDDFEHYAYAILTKNDCAIAKQLKKRYKEIMVDEFQDTSEGQWSLLSLLEDNNLFLVGDVKQSIYRFRNAKPEIMISLRSDPRFEKIHLRENYRSKKNVVEFNNALFEAAMNLRRRVFTPEDVQIPAGFNADKDNSELHFVRALASEKTSSTGLRIVRAKALAQEILETAKEGIPYKEMAVILRSHYEKNEVRMALEDAGIPYFMKDNEGYFNSVAMDVLTSWFRVLEDPHDSISLAAVLSSPFYGLDDEALLTLKGTFKEYPSFREDYERLSALAEANRLSELLHELVSLRHFYDDLPEEEKTNVAYFLAAFENYCFTSLHEMIEFIEESKETQKEAAVGVSEDAPVVKIMTIHGSKGLEYDAVFFLSSHSNKQKSASSMIDIDLGVGLTVFEKPYHFLNNSLKRQAILNKDDLLDQEEYLRLLYVALTRAKKKLVILDAFNPEEAEKDLSRIASERLDFTTVIGNCGLDPQLIQTVDYTFDPEIRYVSRARAQKTELPHKDYVLEEQEEASPSDFEQHSRDLDLDALAGMNYGTRIHEILAKIDYGCPTGDKEIRAIDPQLTDEEVSRILGFANDPLIRRYTKEEIHQEYSFYLREGNRTLHGFMDFVAIGEDILLADYKTDVGADEETLIGRYQGQLNSYLDVLDKLYPQKKKKAYIYALSLKKFIEIKRS